MPMLRTPRRHEEILTHRTAGRNKSGGDSESESCFDVQDDLNGSNNSIKNSKQLHQPHHKGCNHQANGSTVRGSPLASPPSSNNGGGFFASSSTLPSTFLLDPPRRQQRRRIRKRENHKWTAAAQVLTAAIVLVTILGIFRSLRTESSGTMTSRPQFHKLSLGATTSCSEQLTTDDVSFTLVTQVSSDRLWMMEQQCQRWKYNNETYYPISLAVLTNDTKATVVQQLRTMGCDVDKIVTVQTLSAKLFPYDDYPVNVLRNLALNAVQTSHVVYIDIDFWITRDLSAILQLPEVIGLLASDPKATLVIPAFMLLRQCKQWKECPEKNVPHMPMDLSGLKDLIFLHEVTRFDPTNRGGHGSTRYKDWFKQNYPDGDAVIEIDCFLSNRYEPYLVFRYCRELPPFQEPFSGYGKNKMTWVMHLRRLGYTFWQLGKGAFVIHYPHLDSPSRVAWNDAPRKLTDPATQQWLAYKRGRMDQLFVEFREWLWREIPDETKVPFCKDKLDDDATLRYDRETFRNHTAHLVHEMTEHDRRP